MQIGRFLWFSVCRKLEVEAMCWNTIKVRFRIACQAVLVMLALSTGSFAAPARTNDTRPNILLAISDDQSWLHTGAAGDPVVKTPAFDRIASEGVQFTNAYCAAPSCGPSRSAILTGQAIWRLEQAGNIHSTLASKFEVYTDLLEEAGYFVGSTSKAWGPGRLEPGGRTRNPAGERFSDFDNFLGQIPQGQPFCFWLGSSDPFFGDLEPGESKSADGKLIIFAGGLEQFEKESLLLEP